MGSTAEAMTYFFMIAPRVFSKSMGPVAGTKTVSDVSESNAVRVLRSWLARLWSKFLTGTLGHDEFSRDVVVSRTIGEGVTMTSGTGGRELTLWSCRATSSGSHIGYRGGPINSWGKEGGLKGYREVNNHGTTTSLRSEFRIAWHGIP